MSIIVVFIRHLVDDLLQSVPSSTMPWVACGRLVQENSRCCRNTARAKNKKWRPTSSPPGTPTPSPRCHLLGQRLTIHALRLLAHAGFNPRQAVRFWEGRADTPQTAECSPARAEIQTAHDQSTAAQMARRLIGETHPVHEVRISTLKAELARWEEKRMAARAARDRRRAQEQPQQ